MGIRLSDFAFKSIVALASASLGINSYLVKEKVSDISIDIKALSAAYHDLRVEGAVRDELINGMRTRLEICEVKTGRAEEKLHGLEVKFGARR